MTVPSRAEAARLLLSLNPPPWHLRHSRAVAEVAGWLARRIARRQPSVPIDRGLVEAAALLHDVDKAMPKGRRPPGHRHGVAGGAWLTEQGHPELASAVALHPVTRLVAPDGLAKLQAAPLEARVVAYADRRAHQRLVSMAARFARWDTRHPHGWTPAVRAQVWARAQRIEREICELAGCTPEEVGRLAWTRAAFAEVKDVQAAVPPGTASGERW
jgi:HD domain